ncbi:ATP-binding protein [Phenylobacterium sp. RIFCSPHIGHO2_01_FULL_69_31]|uniref:PAS domain-containing sensor histidine kinase n=1 Tax=Phenylobacterium sp. RIFCSPHIGHO2_01_FULL_69_31 TaxID=1801944 RepID=UPI0025E2D618|nr:ATP-binding protein [Phenylobacterium sp. RIFCSPHIGHO2_01_FULL_69_31]
MGELRAQPCGPAAVVVENATLAAGLSCAPIPVTLLDANAPGRPIVYCNEAFCQLTGYPIEDVIGRGLNLLSLPADEGRDLDAVVSLAMPRRELQMRRRDGRPFWNALSSGPVRDEAGRVTHVVVTHTDITEHRQRDEALQSALTHAERANWAKSRLIAVAGHDLRQPLQTIVAALDLLRRETDLSARGRRLLGHAEIAAVDLDEELKALAQVSEVKQDLAPVIEDFALDEILDGVIAAWRPRAEHKGLSLRTACTHVAVRSDRAMLRTILRNLVGNAVKYTFEGGVLIGVRRRGGGLAIEVWDTGAGVPPHMLERIFEAFERADSTGNEGLGLGLWIVQKTAQLLGHTIEVRSVAGRGSCFSIRLERGDPAAARENAGVAQVGGLEP